MPNHPRASKVSTQKEPQRYLQKSLFYTGTSFKLSTTRPTRHRPCRLLEFLWERETPFHQSTWGVFPCAKKALYKILVKIRCRPDTHVPFLVKTPCGQNHITSKAIRTPVTILNSNCTSRTRALFHRPAFLTSCSLLMPGTRNIKKQNVITNTSLHSRKKTCFISSVTISFQWGAASKKNSANL